jgi:hypothetical protein
VRRGGFHHQDSAQKVLGNLVRVNGNVTPDSDFYARIVVEADEFVGDYLSVVRETRTGDTVLFVADYQVEFYNSFLAIFINFGNL